MKGWATAVAVVAAVGGIAGCATVEATPEQAVKERAQAKWDALVKGDTKTAYGYFSPGSREVLSLEAYDAAVRKGFWKSAQVERVVCANPDSCDAIGTMQYTYQGRAVTTPFRETWVRSGKDWWYVQK